MGGKSAALSQTQPSVAPNAKTGLIAPVVYHLNSVAWAGYRTLS